MKLIPRQILPDGVVDCIDLVCFVKFQDIMIHRFDLFKDFFLIWHAERVEEDVVSIHLSRRPVYEGIGYKTSR